MFFNTKIDYIIPSDNWEQQRKDTYRNTPRDYIIPSDNWEQQPIVRRSGRDRDYIIPSDNWEQQRGKIKQLKEWIISYQAITGNNNPVEA